MPSSITNRTSVDQLIVPAGASERRPRDVGARQRFDDHLDRAIADDPTDERTSAAALVTRRTDERARLERRRLDDPSLSAGRQTPDQLDSSDVSTTGVVSTPTDSPASSDDPEAAGNSEIEPSTTPAAPPPAATMPVPVITPANLPTDVPSLAPSLAASAVTDAAPAEVSPPTAAAVADGTSEVAVVAVAAPSSSQVVAPEPAGAPGLARSVPVPVPAPSPDASAGAAGVDESAVVPRSASPIDPARVLPDSGGGAVDASPLVDAAAPDAGAHPAAVAEPPAAPADSMLSPPPDQVPVDGVTPDRGAGDSGPRVARPGGSAGPEGSPRASAITAAATTAVAAAATSADSADGAVVRPARTSAGPAVGHISSAGTADVSIAADTVMPEASAPAGRTVAGDRAGHGLPVSVPRLSIDLSDEGLGPLTLQARHGAGGVHVRLTAGDAAVGDTLARAGVELRRELEAGGVALGSLDIGHGDVGRGGAERAAWNGPRDPGGRRGPGEPALRNSSTRPAVSLAPTSLGARGIARDIDGAEGVDVRI